MVINPVTGEVTSIHSPRTGWVKRDSFFIYGLMVEIIRPFFIIIGIYVGILCPFIRLKNILLLIFVDVSEYIFEK